MRTPSNILMLEAGELCQENSIFISPLRLSGRFCYAKGDTTMDRVGIESIRRLRNACDAIVQASDAEDEQAIEDALGKFLLALMQLDALK